MATKLRVLLIEDTPADAELVCHELRRAGLAVETRCVDTRAEFLAQLQDFDPEAVLADYSMPQFTAGEALRLVKEQGRIIPFLLVTGTQSEEVAVRCLKEGMDDYILKSSLARLPAALLNAVEKKRAERERAAAVAALRRSEEMYRTVTENSQDLITTVDLHGRVIYASASHADVLGYLPTGRYVQQSLERVHPDDQAALAKACRRAFRGGKPPRVVWRHRSQSNGWLVLETLCGVATIEGEACLVAVSRDISERRQMERRLAESEERFRRLAESAFDGIIVHVDGRYAYANPAAMKLLGAERQEDLLCKSFRDFAHPDYVAKIEERVRLTLQGVRLPPVESKRVRLDGTVVDVEVAVTPTSYQGKPAVQAMMRDISERKRTEARLRESLRQVRATMEGAIQAISIVTEMRDPYTAGHQRRVALLACAIAEKLGLEPERVLGIRVAGLIHDVGKVIVPAEILSKTGKLTNGEMAIIKDHPQAGYEILRAIDFPWPVATTTLQHHERLDGSGYPLGATGEEISLDARILAVADVVESMSSHRPFRPALGVDRAMGEITDNSGRHYDAQVVEACRQVIAGDGFEFE